MSHAQDLNESIRRYERRLEIAGELAAQDYNGCLGDDLEIVEGIDGKWFVESVDAGYWVEARVWVDMERVEAILEKEER